MAFAALANRQADKPNNLADKKEDRKRDMTAEVSGSDGQTGRGSVSSNFSDDDFLLKTPHAKKLVKAAVKTMPLPFAREPSMRGVPRLTREELEVGKVVGVGGFGYVNEVQSSTVNKDGKKMVLKTLVPHQNPHSLLFGCHHLETEKRVLSRLNHPNIIQLRGCSADGLQSIAETKRLDSVFLLFDYLPETLSDRIEKWAEKRQSKQKSSLKWPSTKSKSLLNDPLFPEQLQVAVGIASALTYLHEKRIILRDLKPDNVGFDETGCVKLFDFGLVSQLPEDSDMETTHKLEGKVGTPRYMATEVIRELPYNVKADVFSFSLLFWEMLTQEKPHDKSPGAGVYGDRPKIPKHWPGALRRILERGWSDDLSERPCMVEFKLVLEDLHRQASA